ncbi:MAG: hypothetical protein ACYC3I_12330 [Gemmataceae bacterium]
MNRPAEESVVPYETPCPCGRLLRGQRQASSQVISCPNCGRKCFILPNSAWLAPAAPATPSEHGNLSRLLLIIALGGVLAMALIFLAVRPYLQHPRAAADLSSSSEDSHALFLQGELHLREGNVFLALRELNAALEHSDNHPNELGREDRRRLEQLRRQADLLELLLDQPLEEIVQQATQHRNAEEWRAKFAHYRGRTVVFDDVLRRDMQGRPVLAFYVVRAGGIEARIALEDLALLRQLPLDPPRRWLFGARLAECRREEGGKWVFRFAPDSAVLLSDAMAAEVCCPLPLDEELLAVLKRQDEWLRR